MPDEAGGHLVRRFGTQYRRILERIDAEPGLAELLAPPYPYSAAEAVYAAQMEMAQSLTDFMTRRTHLIYAGGADNRAIAERAARAMASAIGWGEDDVRRELDEYMRERERRRAPLAELT